jgi:hypothetical protein
VLLISPEIQDGEEYQKHMVNNKLKYLLLKFSIYFRLKGECPILTGEIAVAFNKGLMGYAKLEDTQLEYGIYKVIPVMR